MVQVYLFTMEPHLHANLRVLGQVCLLFRLEKKTNISFIGSVSVTEEA